MADYYADPEPTAAVADSDFSYILKKQNTNYLIDAYFGHAEALRLQREYSEAIKTYSLLIEDKAHQPLAEYYAMRGYSFYCLGQWEDAIQDLTKAKDGYKSVLTLVSLGDAYRFLGDPYTAIKVYEEAKTQYPGKFSGYYGCGLAYVDKFKLIPEQDIPEKQETLEQARNYLDIAKGIAENQKQQFSAIYRELAAVEDRLGDHEKAKETLKKARMLERDIGSSVPSAQLTTFHLWPPLEHALLEQVSLDEETADLKEEYAKLTEKEPDNPDAFYGKGRLHLKSKETEEAIRCFNRVIELKNDFADVYYCRAWALAYNKDWIGSIGDCDEAIKLKEDMAQAYWLKGFALNQWNKLNEAIINFKTAIQYNPKFADAHYALIWTRTQKKEWEKAIEDSDHAIGHGIENKDIYIIRTEAYRMMGKLDQSLEECEKALKLAPKFGSAYQIRGFVLLQQGKLDKAINDLNNAIEIDKKNAEAYCGRGEYHRLRGELDKAIHDFSKAIKLSDQFTLAYYNRGWARIHMWDRTKLEADLNIATQDFEQVVSLEKTYPAGYCGLGECYRLKGEPEKALTQLRKAYIRDPEFYLIYQIRGWVYYQKGKKDIAIGEFSKAINLNPPPEDAKYAYYGRGECNRMKEKWNVAIKDYTEAIKLGQNFAPVYYMRGWVFTQYGDWEGAIQDYSSAIKKGLESADLFLNRALAYYKMENDEEALQDFQSAHDLDPKSTETYIQWGIILGFLGRREEAVAKFSRAIDLDPKLDEGYSMRGWARCYQKDFIGAIDDISTAIRLNSNNPNHFNNRAWVKCQMCLWGEALQDCDKAIKLDHFNDYAYSNRSLARWWKEDSTGALQDMMKVFDIRLLNRTPPVPKRERDDSSNWTETAQDWTYALENKPKDAVAYLGRAISQWMAGKLDTTIDDLNRAITLNPELTEIARIRDLVHREKGEGTLSNEAKEQDQT